MKIQSTPPQTVGSISTIEELRNWGSDNTPDCDILEIRLDGIDSSDLEEAFNLCLRVKSWSMPILITARVKSEGGITELDVSERCRRLEMFAEVASYADVEIASYPDMEETVDRLRQQEIIIVLSYHNFTKTPSLLEDELALAITYGADIPKFAVMHNSPADLQTCVDVIESSSQAISIMGMGDLAPVSRLLYAQLGSVLNYGYLGEHPTAPGQWSSKRLKDNISSLKPLSQ